MDDGDPLPPVVLGARNFPRLSPAACMPVSRYDGPRKARELRTEGGVVGAAAGDVGELAALDEHVAPVPAEGGHPARAGILDEVCACHPSAEIATQAREFSVTSRADSPRSGG